MNSAWTTNKLQ